MLASGCGGGGDITDPLDEELIPGVTLSASVVELDVTEATGSRIKMVSAEVALQNTTAEPIEHSYPGGCPVRMRLYRQSDNALIYDQTLFPCNVSAVQSFTLPAQGAKSFTSGARFPWEVAGDSIPPATYRATAVFRVTGLDPVEIEAGTYRVPTCNLTSLVPSCQ